MIKPPDRKPDYTRPPFDDMEEREQIMKRDVLLVAIAGMSLLNGMHFSPYFDPVAILLRPFIAGTLLSSPLVYLYLASMFVSLMSLLIAGIPAALYERMTGVKDSTSTSLGIWFAAMLVVSLPSLLAMAGG